MSNNFTTIKSITDNLQSVLLAIGIKFSRKAFEDAGSIPLSLLPFGEIYYKGESFEYTHGQRSGYAEANYLIKVITQGHDNTELVRTAQKWVHGVRDSITINALNIGELATSKLVSWVNMESVEIVYTAEYGTIDYVIKIRYRET